MRATQLHTFALILSTLALTAACQSVPEPDPGEGQATLTQEPAAYEGEPVCTTHGLDSLQAWVAKENFTGPKAEVLIARGLLRDEVCPDIDADIRTILEAHAHPETLVAENDALIAAAQRQLDAQCDRVFLMRAQTLTEQFTACFGAQSPLATPAEVDTASSAVISAGLVYIWMTEHGSDPALSRAILRRFAAIEPPFERVEP